MVEDLLPDEDSGKVRHTAKRDGNIANVYFDGDGEGVDTSIAKRGGTRTGGDKEVSGFGNGNMSKNQRGGNSNPAYSGFSIVVSDRHSHHE
jgi:hypothetical protein